MAIAMVVATRSHDAETKVGAVLVDNDTGAIKSTGYNGFVRGADDALLPATRPDKYPYMIHAEQNLITNCARHGIGMENCSIVCTHSPCAFCMRLLWQCGITDIIVKERYRDFELIRTQLDIHVSVSRTTEGFFKLSYSAKDSRGARSGKVKKG